MVAEVGSMVADWRSVASMGVASMEVASTADFMEGSTTGFMAADH